MPPSSSPSTSLQSGMVTGFKWSFAATFIQGILQVGVTMTMARLLLPADYGLYAMVDVVLRWAGLMGQMGLATVLVQKAVLNDVDLRAARTLALTLAVVAAAVVAGGAPWIAAGFGNTSIIPLLRVAALSFLLNGLGLTSLAMLRRRMQFGSLSAAELGGYVIGNGFTAIVLAINGAGVWSVVAGTLVGQLVQNSIAIWQARLPFGFSANPAVMKPLIRQGGHVSLNTCLDIAHNTMDTFVIARVLPQATLGLYNRALMLATLPVNFLWTAVSKVTFPSYSRLQHEPATFSLFFKQTQSWSGTLCVAVPLGMIPAADTIVRFLLGEAWLPAVPIVRLLLLAYAFESLVFPYQSALDALGRYSDRTRIRLIILTVRAAALALIVFGGFSRGTGGVEFNHGEIPGVAPSGAGGLLFWVGSLAAAATWLISIWPVAHRLGQPAGVFFWHDLKIIFRAVLCAVAVAAAHAVTQHFGLHLTLVGLLACAGAGALVLGLLLWPEIKALRNSK